MLIIFPDGAKKRFPQGSTALDVAVSISQGFARAVLVAKINDELTDLNYVIEEDSKIEFFKFDSKIGKEIYWHSTAHLLAQAVKELFPDVKVAIGPSIENGFYYDFEKEDSFTLQDLENITKKMKDLSKKKMCFCRKNISREQALKLFSSMGENYKVELLEAIDKQSIISTYTQGDFVDLCRGPHLLDTSKIKAIKLLKTSGAYWRGNEKNTMLKRIYGISFQTNKELNIYLKNLEEAKKRDHRLIGKNLDLFSFSEKIGAGLALWHPKGALIRHFIETFWKQEHLKHGYDLVNTPHIGKADLWETSGHLGFYNQSMYSPMDIDGQNYYIKPMNCPFHIEIYNNSKKSYRHLPIRYAEMGSVYRYERAGTLHGLMRVRGFTQDDAHIICTKAQLDIEVKETVKFSLYMLKSFGFDDLEIYLSTCPSEKFVGEKDDWNNAENALKIALKNLNIDYDIDEGGGAFYGPKIDIKIKDALGRSWQCSTIQFDFNLPMRFNMSYVGKDNALHRPYMIHRALLGSLERFFATLLEFHGGNLPFWLAPIQVKIIPISEQYDAYCQRVKKILQKHDIRVELNLNDESVSYKIRDAERQKIPFMFICGQDEAKDELVSVRVHTKGDIGKIALKNILEVLK